MNSQGYRIIKNFIGVDDETFELMSKLIKTAEPIFNDNPMARRNDNKRLQLDLSPKLFRTDPWFKSLKRQIQELGSPEHVVSDTVLLSSLPGCKAQAAHTDYVPDEALKSTTDDTVPLLFLLSLEDNTFLNVWPASHHHIQKDLSPSPIRRKTLVLKKGDAVLFRADLVHGGAAYNTSNMRLHAYLDHPSVPRDPNRTWIVYKHADKSSSLYASIIE
jgi:ectoine hydroxylase-related dioxygenase (phytanoyl-CoA dioxygenase family)